MAYTPKTWACGDTITAEDLNHIEQGISENSGGGTPLIVHETSVGGIKTLDKTWQEIYDAMPSAYVEVSGGSTVYKAAISYVIGGGGVYHVSVAGQDSISEYKADNADGYPYYDELS